MICGGNAMDDEIWKPLMGKPWCDVFEVSNKGRVRYAPRILKTRKNQGYDKLTLKFRGQEYFVGVHRLMAEAFLERPPGCDVVNHKNFDRADNRLDNLEWVTSRENIQHSARALRLCRVIKMPPGEVIRLHKEGVSMNKIAKRFGASTTAVSALIKRMKSDGRYDAF